MQSITELERAAILKKERTNSGASESQFICTLATYKGGSATDYIATE
jgi:hypothetical protein